MKKLMMLMVAVAAALTLMAETENVGGYTWTYRIVGGMAEIYNGYSAAISPAPVGSLSVPATLGGMSVTRIGDYAFKGFDALRHVTFADGIKDVGCYAFEDTGLTEVRIPCGVTNIDDYAFYCCDMLTNAVIPESVVHVGKYAFHRLLIGTAIGDATIVPGFAVVDGWIVGRSADWSSESARGLDLTRFRGVADGVLEQFSDLESITLTQKECNRRLGEVLPKNFHALTEVVVASDVTSLAEDLFVGCENLKSVYLPKALEGSVSATMFEGCPEDLSISYYGQRCSVAFDANGGSAVERAVSLPKGHPIGTLPTTAREGYAFLGWFTAADGGEQVTPETIVVEDVTCYAHWKINSYTLTFDASDPSYGYAVDSTFIVREHGARIGEFPMPAERVGFTFAGWYRYDEMWNEVTDTPETIVTENATYYALWEPKQEVYIDWNISAEWGYGGDYYSRRYSGDRIGELPSAPTWYGHSFLGWFTAAEGGEQVTPETIVTESVVYYVHWKAISYVITFEGCQSVERDYGTTIGELPMPTKEGHAFLGWFTAADGGEEVTAGTFVTGAATYYPHWRINVYTITFDGVSTVEREHGTTIGELPAPTKKGYSFLGWFTAAEGGEQVMATTAVTATMTLYAHWKEMPRSGVMDPLMIKQQTVVGGVQDASGNLVGTIRLAVGKAAKGGVIPVAASVKLSTGVTVSGEGSITSSFNMVGGDDVASGSVVFGVLIGKMDFKMTEGGVFLLSNENYKMVEEWTGTVPDPIPVPGVGPDDENDSDEGPSYEPVPPTGDETAGVLDTAFKSVQDVSGVLYNMEGYLSGVVQIKIGAARNDKVKVSASATMMTGKKVSAKAASFVLEDGTLSGMLTFKAPIGEMEFYMNEDGVFTLENDGYIVEEAIVGNVIESDELTFNVDIAEVPDFGEGWELLDDALPEDVPVRVTNGGKKWSCDKTSSIKYKRFRDDGETWYELVGLDDEAKPNVSGLKLTYTAKTGVFKGSFKLYATNEATTPTGKAPKLKKFTVNVIGFVVDGKGYGEATLKKPAGTWAVMVE